MATNYDRLGAIYRDRGDQSTALSVWKAAAELYERAGLTAEADAVRGQIQSFARQ